jgi:hypothetical protein
MHCASAAAISAAVRFVPARSSVRQPRAGRCRCSTGVAARDLRTGRERSPPLREARHNRQIGQALTEAPSIAPDQTLRADQ